ncbi:hypothetical protein Q5H92_13680 [Hymenobacter sp. M29]|uniref:Lipoprotein n=1 Tax=Hymenobacter mellowenesis TaxID=3063995 RepID=A0ABT9AE33_9BACT|nr:hypothetical protein [Hymenobacter sp. M29]MDO7847415.1 hypothetical protein [Hymenobacter sp. M29]
MKPRLLALYLLATGLLLSTMGCSKKNDPESTANTASYVSDGRRVSCTATADLYTNAGTDYLTLDLTTAPQLTAGKETLRLLYVKSTSDPASAYELTQLQQFDSGAIIILYAADAYTLTPNSDGTFSGTFSSGAKHPNPGITAPTLTSGVFTNVRP